MGDAAGVEVREVGASNEASDGDVRKRASAKIPARRNRWLDLHELIVFLVMGKRHSDVVKKRSVIRSSNGHEVFTFLG